jgi:hypothetical protein
MLRNLIINLEYEKRKFEIEIDKDSNTKDSLSEYNRMKLEELKSEKSKIENNENIIIDTLNSKFKNLELEILNLEKLVKAERTEIDNNRGKQRNFLETNAGMAMKKQKKIIAEMRLENEKINHQINKQKQEIKNKKKELEEVLYELN